MKLTLPYGKTGIEAVLPEGHEIHVMRNGLHAGVHAGVRVGRQEDPAEQTPWEIVRASMEHPYGGCRLTELAAGKRNIVLIASDHTRPVPSRIIVPQMLAEIREGNPEAQVTILIATGCHRETTREELTGKFGEEIVANETIAVHDCEDQENLVCIGTLPSGGSLEISRIATQADLLVAEGFIEPHFFAGFSGGRKSVLPGIASRACVHYNHNSGFMDDPHARMGILDENPIHRDMAYAAQCAKLAYIVNVVLDGEGRVAASFAGSCEEAHRAGAEFVRRQTGCVAQPADIVITTNNGYPLDQNIYQMVKGMCTAEAVCRDGGVIIAVGECADGVGGDGFFCTFRDCTDVTELLRQFRETPPEETVTDQWQSHIFARILEKHTVILVSGVEEETVRALHMIPAKTVEEAVDRAISMTGLKHCDITVIPEGISTIVLKEDQKEREDLPGKEMTL